MTTYRKPNYQLAQEKAYNTIVNSELTTLPINLRSIINRFNNLHLQRYSVFAWNNGLTIDEVCYLFNSKEGCLWRRSDNKYIILYNDTVESKERIRFTIAHEIGHYVLGHHELSDKTKISRYTLSMEEDEAFEKEANYFAKRLLAPLPLIYSFASIWNRISSNLIKDIFDVSFSVSNFIIGDLKRASRYGITGVRHDINFQFEKYIEKIKHALWCNNCMFAFSSATARFCSICGEGKLIDDSMFVVRRNSDMTYPAYELDDEMRVKQCPRCENKEVSGNYCKICAEYLFNICTGYDEYFQNNNQQGMYWHEHNSGCGNKLDGNARFCHECGSTSSFFEEGLLEEWDVESEERNKELVSTDGIEIDIADDGLPF